MIFFLILNKFLSKITNLNQQIMKILILSYILLKITNLNQKIMKILILIQFLSKITNFMKIMPGRSATQRDAARRRLKISRRSATPTEDFATQRGADWRFRDAARRQEIYDFLWLVMIFWLKFVIFDKNWIKIKIFIIFWFKFVVFYKM